MSIVLTENDRKVLKYEKRIGYVFAGLILSFAGLLNLFYFLLKKIGQNCLMIGLIDLGVLVLAYFVCNRINLKVNRDLKDNKKELLKRTIDKKNEENSYEAGSGTLYIPILGNLFPKLWGQKMRETKKYFIFTIDNIYEVDKEVYNELIIGDDFYIHFARHSETILNFSKDE